MELFTNVKDLNRMKARQEVETKEKKCAVDSNKAPLFTGWQSSIQSLYTTLGIRLG
jgi:hypothetical protein